MKRFLTILSLVLLFICTFSTAASDISIKVNNKYIASDVTPFIKSGTTYVPIRFVANALNVDYVNWNSNNQSVSIKDSDTSILLFVNKNYAYVNNEYKTLTNNALLVNERTFVPIRFISEILGADVKWNEDTYTVSITTNSNQNTTSSSPSKNPSNSSSNNSVTNNYDQDAVYWLSRIIEAEAGGEPFKGKVAVGEVILNRVESEEFPDTIWEVIFDKQFGIQFEPVANGSIYNTPSKDSINAAKTALSGSNYVGDSLYFLNPTIAESNWIVKNRKFYTTIANHDFYA